MDAYVKVGGAWKRVSKMYIKVSGAWKEIKNGYIKVGGVWKKFFQHLRVDAVGGTYLATTLAPTDAISQFRLNTNGNAESSITNPSNFNTVAPWLLDGVPGDYDVRWSPTGDTGSISVSAINTWLNLASTRNWALTDTVAGGLAFEATGPIEIRDASTLTVLSTKTLTLRANQDV